MNNGLTFHHPLARLLAALVLILTLAPNLSAMQLSPLEPPNTSNPRATLESFLLYSEAFARTIHSPDKDSRQAKETLERAIRCLDLSGVAPTIVHDVGVESVLRLREIFDRIPLPEGKDIPDNSNPQGQAVVKWTLPQTEIAIAKVTSGQQNDAFLFTSETIHRLDEYYTKVRYLPYKDGATEGVYEEYIYASGWLIPPNFVKKLPAWLKQGYMEQALWQWIGLVVATVGAGLVLWGLLGCYRRWESTETSRPWRLRLLIPPLAAMGLCSFLRSFLDTQINITGEVLNAVTMGIEFFFLLFNAWAILVGGKVIMHGIITSQHIKEDALDADVIKLACRLLSFFLIFVVFYRAGNYFGLPVTAIFTSAGIAGVAVALAARETLANFFGGVSIFLDRPFRAGDYIILDTGERGAVKAVGMRSTRILTRDDILITIPNSVITNVKIVNQSLPQQHFRIRLKIGVAYGSDLEQVEKILVEVAQANPLIMPTPAPRVRLRSFGNSALHFELLAWVVRPHDHGRSIHEMSKALYYRFRDEGIEIPYPQLDVHLRDGQEGKVLEPDETAQRAPASIPVFPPMSRATTGRLANEPS